MKHWGLIRYESIDTMAYQASQTRSRIWTWVYSTLTLKILIYYIGESRSNPPGVSWYWSLIDFSGDFGDWRDGLLEEVGGPFIGGARHPVGPWICANASSEPSLWTDHDPRWRLILKGSGEPTFEVEPDRWVPERSLFGFGNWVTI
jgi:hypothetical protein